MLTDDEVQALSLKAFRPLRCVIEILPDSQLRFQVIKQSRRTAIRCLS